MARVVVVGGGLAGLVAARELAAQHDVLVLEGSPLLGGKLRTGEVAGVRVDVGAEAMLARRPEGVGLLDELGLTPVHPTSAASRLWVDGTLRPLPRSLMGVPMDLAALEQSGVLGPEAMEQVRAEPHRRVPPPSGDVAVGDLVGERLGPEVVDRLVEPLLGGVYAGHAGELSTQAAVPQLLSMAREGSLVEAAAAVPRTDGPVFAGLEGGLGQLPDRLADTPGVSVRTAATVRELRRAPTGFELVVGPTIAPEVVAADHVVLATPAAPTARLLGEVVPGAARRLAEVEYASVAVVTLAFRAADVEGLAALDGSVTGFLVPPSQGRTIKASTFSFAKWDWVRAAGRGAGPAGEDLLVLRTSLGRHREEATLQATDEELVAASLRDLAAATGLAGRPVDSHVQRWGGGLPQYAVGHVERVAAVQEAVAVDAAAHAGRGRLAVCGAAYDGLGIPAVIGSARRAAGLVRG